MNPSGPVAFDFPVYGGIPYDVSIRPWRWAYSGMGGYTPTCLEQDVFVFPGCATTAVATGHLFVPGVPLVLDL